MVFPQERPFQTASTQDTTFHLTYFHKQCKYLHCTWSGACLTKSQSGRNVTCYWHTLFWYLHSLKIQYTAKTLTGAKKRSDPIISYWVFPQERPSAHQQAHKILHTKNRKFTSRYILPRVNNLVILQPTNIKVRLVMSCNLIGPAIHVQYVYGIEQYTYH